MVEIQVLGQYHPDTLHELTDKLSAMGLLVLRAISEQSSQPHLDGAGAEPSGRLPNGELSYAVGSAGWVAGALA